MPKIHLQPKQGQLLDLVLATGPEVPTVIGAGGAKGGGKSKGTRNIALIAAGELGEMYPGIVICIVRRVARDLLDNHITPLFRDHPELFPFWHATDKELWLPDKGKILFRSAETEDDVKRLFVGGFEAAIIIIDEAQQFSQMEIQWISTAARWTAGSSGVGIPEGLCKTVLLFNPGGKGSDFIRRIFWLRRYEGKERAGNYTFIHVFGWDNYEWFRSQVDIAEDDFYALSSEERFELFITKTSEGRKYDAYPESIRAGYLLGSFDHFEGQYFAGVWDEKTCTITQGRAEALIQSWWVRWMSLDWGFAHWSSVFWCANGRMQPDQLRMFLGVQSQIPRDVIVVYRELVANQTPEFELGSRIVDLTPAIERKEIRRWFVGHDCFSKDRFAPNTPSVLIQAATKPAGLPEMEKAVTDRIPGARTLHDMLRRTNALRAGAEAEDSGTGPLLLISDACPHLMAAIPVLICDPDRLEDVYKPDVASLNDDVYDGWRYAIESWVRAKATAPVEVRAREVYNSVDDMTAKALKMRVFAEQEKQRYAAPQRRFRRG